MQSMRKLERTIYPNPELDELKSQTSHIKMCLCILKIQ